MNDMIGIIWSGTVPNLKNIEEPNLRIFQHVPANGVKPIIQKLELEGASAIIGMAGAITEIRRHATVPVVIAYSTYMDILETIHKVERERNLSGKVIVLILNVLNQIQLERIQPFCRSTLRLYTYVDATDLAELVGNMRKIQPDLILAGPTAVGMAQARGIPAEMIRYSERTILDALERSLEILAALKREQAQTQKLQTVLDIIPDGILSTDARGLVRMCNSNALSILQKNRESVIGTHIQRLTGDATWEDVYTKGAVQTDRLFTYGESKLFSTRRPLMESCKIVGSVGTIQEAVKIQDMERKYRSLQMAGLVARFSMEDIVAESECMKEVIGLAKSYAAFDATILISGETGTGKEIFAQGIHNASPKRKGPFVAINCATLTETLLESELLGYEEGAFTGARKGGKMGLFEQANKGTIFLDEINQIPPALQAKLLRVLQEKVVMRIGGERVVPVDVRIIAATNEVLKDMVATKMFRSDLFYRLNVLNLRLPSLRERRGDIPVLLRLFLEKRGCVSAQIKEIEKAVAPFFAGYDWPGNVRELQNLAERLAVCNQEGLSLAGAIFREILPPEKEPETVAAEEGLLAVRADTLDNMTSQLVRKTVEHCSGNKSKAALLLNVSRNTVNSRLHSA